MKTFEESVESLNWVQEKEPDWVKEYRKTAFEKFKQLGFPNRHHEGWKYIHLDAILKTPLRRSDIREDSKSTSSETIHALTPNESRITFVNGIYSPSLSSLGQNQNVTIQLLKQCSNQELESLKSYVSKTLEQETNSFALINAFGFSDGIVIRIPENVKLENCIHLVFLENPTVESKQIYHSKIIVIAEKNSRCNFYFEHQGNGHADCLANLSIEMHGETGSEINWTSVSDNAFHFLTNRTFLTSGAKLNHVSINLNQSFIRDEIRVDLLGVKASCHISGASILQDNAQAYHHALVNHLLPEGTSKQTYKNVLGGHSKAEFNSLVYVHRNAQKSDSNQLNKNLLLSDSARIFSRPQLKIYADDVKATHGSATGPLQEQELFYLRSRGLSKTEAQKVLTFGFTEEVLQLVESLLLRHTLEQKIQESLQSMIRELT